MRAAIPTVFLLTALIVGVGWSQTAPKPTIKVAQARADSTVGAASLSKDIELIRPTGYRKWVFVGESVTPHDMNDGKAAFPEFHNVYIDTESHDEFEKTGKYRDVRGLAGLAPK